MTLKNLLIIKAIVCLAFGPLLLVFPGQVLDLLGTAFDTGASLTAREYGAALTGTIFLTFLSRNAEDSTARRAILWHLFIYDAIALVVTLSIQLSGGLNFLGWGIVLIYLFFTVGFAFFLPRQKAQQT